MENARYRHALEGELAQYHHHECRDLKSSCSFSHTQKKACLCAMMLSSRGLCDCSLLSMGWTSSRRRFESIINLVSGAVIGLKSEHVRDGRSTRSFVIE
ncbi:hypothetical protein OH492_12715 [Vibrio chagasii]|nr:hypothetical protein [Vibrio chagasii]